MMREKLYSSGWPDIASGHPPAALRPNQQSLVLGVGVRRHEVLQLDVVAIGQHEVRAGRVDIRRSMRGRSGVAADEILDHGRTVRQGAQQAGVAGSAGHGGARRISVNFQRAGEGDAMTQQTNRDLPAVDAEVNCARAGVARATQRNRVMAVGGEFEEIAPPA